MDRASWLRALRRDCEAKYDDYAPLYWKEYGRYRNVTHQEFIQAFLSYLPANSSILDAACGAGRMKRSIISTHSINKFGIGFNGQALKS